MTTLGEVFEIARGGSPRPIEKYITTSPDGLNWVKIGDASAGDGKFIASTSEKIKPEGLSKTRRVRPGDFLLTNSMSFGRPYIMATDGCIHDGWLLLRPRNEHGVDRGYFYHLLSSDFMFARFASRAAGSTVKNLNTEIVSGVQVSLPPLDEQRRVAAILDKADALRQRRKRSIAILDSLMQSIFLDMFGDVVANDRGWANGLTLEDVSDIGSGITKGRPDKGAALREVPYMAVVNVQERHLDLSQVKTIGATEAEIAKFRLEPGDLLLTEGGDPDKLGRGTLWQGELPEAIHQNHIFRVRFDTDQVVPLFGNWLIGSARGKSYFMKSAKQTTGIASINKSQLSSFPMLLPPIAVQKTFAASAATVAGHRGHLVIAANRADDLFASLQHRAFSGQL